MRQRKHARTTKAVRRAWAVGLLAAGMVVLFAAAAYAGYRFDRGRMDRLLPGVRIAGVDVGGMTRTEAAQAISGPASAILNRRVDVLAGTKRWSQSAGSLGVTVDLSQAVDRAFAVSDSFSWPARLVHRLLRRPVDRTIDLTVSYDRSAVDRFIDKAASEVASQPQSASLDFRNGQLVVQHARAGTFLPTGRAATVLLAAVQRAQPSVRLSLRTIRPSVTEDQLGVTIIVRISENHLYLYSGTKLVKTYAVATGQLGIYDTPRGRFEIVDKQINPTWYNPALTTWGKGEPAVIGPGPNDPLGTRGLYLSAPGIIIHGTPSDYSIGHYASHGCIRMHIPDSEDLYPRVAVGTPVIIVW